MLVLHSVIEKKIVLVCCQLPCIYSWRIGNVNTVIVSVELGKLKNLLKTSYTCILLLFTFEETFY